MKKLLILLLVVGLVGSVTAASIDTISEKDASILNRMNPAANMVKLGDKVKAVIDRTSSTDSVSDGADNLLHLAVATYDYDVDASRGTFDTTLVDTSAMTITVSSHGLSTGDAISFDSYVAGNILPAPLVESTGYFAIKVSNNKISVATTLANALGDTAIDFTTKGTGDSMYVEGKKFGSIDLGVELPDNAIILNSVTEIFDTFLVGTTGITVESANDVISGLKDSSPAITVAAESIKTTAARKVILTVSDDEITAGKVKVALTYYISE